MNNPQPIPPQRGITLDYYSPQNLRPPKPIRLIVLAVLGIVYGSLKLIWHLPIFFWLVLGMLNGGAKSENVDTLFVYYLTDATVSLALGLWELIGSILCLRQMPTAIKVMVSFGWVALVVAIADKVVWEMLILPQLQIVSPWWRLSWGALLGIGWAVGFQVAVLVVMQSAIVKRSLQPASATAR